MCGGVGRGGEGEFHLVLRLLSILVHCIEWLVITSLSAYNFVKKHRELVLGHSILK